MDGHPFERLQAALAGHYRVEHVLGSGAMATVYLAEDLKHRRKVAVKVLKPALAAVIGTNRFLREIEIVGGFNHPHILPLYDSGESHGLLFYVMPYVEGETLRDRLRREKQLPVNEAVDIARQVAEAIGYALSRGVVHRDIKPENILLTGGHAMVADFGIAQALSRTGDQRLTETGIVLGTPPYMSPEQVLGEQELDSRSDVYALGCVLYELLAGEPPYSGPTAQSIVVKHLTDAVPDVRRLRGLVPEHVGVAIDRALAKSRVDRFATPQDFAEALLRPEKSAAGAVAARASANTPARLGRLRNVRVVAGFTLATIVAAVTLVLALDAGGVRDTVARRFGATAVPNADRRSIAVLPFDNVGREADKEYFSDGLAEELIVALSRVRELRVAARTSAFAFKGQARDVREIARALDVATVLVGSVRMLPGRVRVTAQLIDASTGLNVWSERYDDERPLSDIFDIQSDVALRIAGALEAKLTPSEQERLARKPTDNVEAYTLYLKGRYFWNRRGAGLFTAIDYFNKALQVDSQYALAWAGLANAYGPLGVHGYMRPQDAKSRMREAAYRAVALDPDLAESRTALATYLYVHEWNWPEAEKEFRRAIELDPSYRTAHAWYGFFLEAMGRFDEAVAERRRSAALDPLATTVGLGTALKLAGHVDLAIDNYRSSSELDPQYWQADEGLGEIYEERGQLDEAARAFERAIATAGSTYRPKAHFARVLARAGKKAAAERLLDELRAQARTRDIYHPVLAPAFVALGDMDGAIDWLEKAYAQRHPDLIRLNVDWPYRALRGDARFADLLRRMQFPPT